MNAPRGAVPIQIHKDGNFTHGEIQSFKPGGLLLSIETGIPIVPVAIDGTFQSLRKGSKKFTKHKLILSLGEPISTSEYLLDDRKQLAKDVREAVLQLQSEIDD